MDGAGPHAADGMTMTLHSFITTMLVHAVGKNPLLHAIRRDEVPEQ